MTLPTVTTELCLSAGASEYEASDVFTRADSTTTMGTSDTGQAWFPGVGTWGISTNTAYLVTDSGENVVWVRSLAGGTVQATLSTTQDAVGLCFRVQDASNYWKIQTNSASGRWDLYVVQAGVATSKGNTGTANVASGAVIKVLAEGDSIKIYVDAVLKLTVADSTFQDQPRCGFYANTTGVARFDSFTAGFVWTDISAYVRNMSYRRGRQHELDVIEAGTCRVTLDNRDRRFEPEYASGAYYPFILPMRRLRVTATFSSVDYGRFYGFVERWPLAWPALGKDATVTIEAVDALGAYGLFPAYPLTLLELSPQCHAYYRLGDSASAPVDSGPNSFAAATTSNVSVVLPGLLPALAGDNGSLIRSGASGYVEIPTAAGLTAGTGDFTVTAITSGTAAAWNVMQYNIGGTTAILVAVDSTKGYFYTNNGTTVTVGTSVINDGDPHHLMCVRRSGTLELWVDGVLEASTAGSTSTVNSPTLIQLNNSNSVTSTIDEVAWWNRALPADDIELLAALSGQATFAGQTTGARVSQIADLLSFSPSQRSVDTGVATMQASAFGAQTPRDALNQTAATEEGLIYINGGGTLVFRDRTDPFDQSSLGTWGDGGGTELPYEDLVPSYDIDRVYNDVRLQRDGSATVTKTDTTSRVRYGSQTLTRTVQHSTDAATVTHADWLIARYKDPHIRVDQIRLRGEVAGWAAVLAREVGDRLTIKRRPTTGGTVMSFDVTIQAIQDDLTPGDWVTTWQLALMPPAP